jgi:predicted 3-demethylubiquinone-9 3-methyltransferase (glyoxalase superfamily)
MKPITPNLWFDGNVEEAAGFYTKLFPNSKIEKILYSPADNPSVRQGEVLTVEFTLNGQRFVGINGGPAFKFTEAVSFEIDCKDQAEVDHYWNALTADGGKKSMCGWCKDRFGLSWQVVPQRLLDLLYGPDEVVGQHVMEAMLTMEKIDIAALEAAAKLSK